MFGNTNSLTSMRMIELPSAAPDQSLVKILRLSMNDFAVFTVSI